MLLEIPLSQVNIQDPNVVKMCMLANLINTNPPTNAVRMSSDDINRRYGEFIGSPTQT